MEKTCLIILVLIALAIPSKNLYASGYLHNLWNGTNITAIHTYKNQVVVRFSELAQYNPDECGSTEWAYINSNSENYDQVLSIALAAQMSGKKIGIWSTGCSTISFWGGTTSYPKIEAMWIVD